MSNITFGTNISSLRAQRELSSSTRSLTQSYERLSSGLRINRASDDAAGLAVSAGLSVASRVFTQGIRNISDGISVLNVADGALSSLSDINTRQRELAEQSANGTLSITQRRALQKEADALTSEFNRIIATTKFNDVAVIDGRQESLQIQFGFGSSDSITATIGGELDRYQFANGFGTINSITQSSMVDGVFADVNQDGKADFIYAQSGTKVRLSNGDGTFGAIASLATSVGMTVTRVALGDMNGDGIVDIVGSSGNYACLNLGNGDGSFRLASATAMSTGLSAGGSASALKLADFNADGSIDILTSCTKSDGEFSILYNSGTGLSSSTGTFSTVLTENAKYVTLGDFNGDGRTDAILGENNAYLLLANSNGTFSYQDLGISPDGVVIDDYNRDGYKDFAYTSGTSINIRIGDGRGNFASAVTVTSGLTAPKLQQSADLNGDGYNDLVITKYSGAPAGFYAAFGNGDGTFVAAISFSTGFSSTSGNATYVADISGDGVFDVANINTSGPKFEVAIAQTSVTTNMKYFSLLSAADSRSALDYLQGVATQIALERGALGSSMGRYEAAIRATSSRQVNIEAANQSIVSVDIADESSQLIRHQILQSASSSVLAQANASPSVALSLLR